ncbi:polysaccharide pyruvyl transferase family protein [Seohaeicola saemankumensis]|nr:polysaccharide pyruvyl transferase family protein [Seohaeicola saemankumensis]
MEMTPAYPALRLHWWKAVPNFGDALSALVVARLSGRPVDHAGPAGADLFAIGSILQVVRRRYTAARADGVRPWIWGSGLLHSVPLDFLDNVRVALLRGPVTAALLGLKPRRFGDPGLLAADLLGERPTQDDRIGLVPHHKQADAPEIRALLEREPALRLIHPGGDALDVCRQIAGCRHVIASSLHGLVVADACGVPSTWLSPGEESHLKYHDYAASIGRRMITPVQTGEIPDLLRGLRDGAALAHADGIEAARAALIETFPAELRAQAAPQTAAGDRNI